MSQPESKNELTESIAGARIVPHPREKDRLDFLTNFENDWKPPSLLRPVQKRKIKEYYSQKQGRDGTRALCCFCNKEFGIEDLVIHHRDHNRTNNQLSNTPPACGPCNNEERKEWLRASHARRASVITPLNKQTENESEQLTEIQQERILKKAPWTSQRKVLYRQKILIHLITRVKTPTPFYQVVADCEAVSECSHDKAIEYLDAFSNSYYAPYAKFQDGDGDWMLKPRPGWDMKIATEEFKKAWKAVQDEQNRTPPKMENH
jgi:hypothetical protein